MTKRNQAGTIKRNYGSDHPLWKNARVTKTCLTCGNEFKTWLSHIKNGAGKHCSYRCGRLGKIPWDKGIHRLDIAGEKNWNWQGGKTPQDQMLMGSLEYKIWRKTVFERDNYTCVFCGDNTGGNLEADHIKPKSIFPELIFVVDNGRTLCEDCHKLTDTYGIKSLLLKREYQYATN